MSIKIKIPEFLRQQTGGESSIDVGGDTLGECLETLFGRYPSLKGEIVDAQGILLLKWMIFVNGRIIKTSEESIYPVKRGDVIELVPMIAGG